MKNFLLFLLAFLFNHIVFGQCPGGTSPSGIELVVNGDFQAGNTGFISAYAYTSPPNTTESQYWVATGAQVPSWNGGMTSIGDHTTGTGNFLFVNGSPIGGTNIWCQTISVTPNTTYLFSAWISTLYPSNPAILQFSINGATLSSTITAPSTTKVWIPFNANWNSASNTSITICIVNQNTSVGGNDFGIDDISFRACGCNFTVSVGNDTSICPGNKAQLHSTSGATDYSWSPAGSLSCVTCQSPLASPTVTTTYSLQASISTCTETHSVVVQVYPLVNANAGMDVSVCMGASVSLNATGGVNYSWTPSTGLSSATISNPMATPIGSTTYSVTVIDANGCTGMDDVAVSFYSPVQANAGSDLSICNTDGGILQASGGVSYLWSPAAGLSDITAQQPSVSTSVATTYTVVVTDANGCTGSDNAVVYVYTFNPVNAGPDTTICFGESVRLHAVGANYFSWSPATELSNATISNPVASPANSTTYSVTATDAHGCTAVTIVNVMVIPDLVVSAGNDATVCAGESVTLHVSGGTKYLWSPDAFLSCADCSSVVSTPEGDITYTIVISDDNGCFKQRDISVEVEKCFNPYVIFPTAFSPNGDGKNDLFFPLTKNVELLSWKVYNRWGEVIFETDHTNATWDGKFNSQHEPVGVYVWYLTAIYTDGTSALKKGNVTLLR